MKEGVDWVDHWTFEGRGVVKDLFSASIFLFL